MTDRWDNVVFAETKNLNHFRLEKEIKSGLGCLLDGKSLLDRCINNLLDTIRKRISVTEELLETKHKLNNIKQKYKR